MALLAFNPRFNVPATRRRRRELTLAQMLSDAIVQAVMKADGIDPKVLEKELRSIAGDIFDPPRAASYETRAAMGETS
jgi:hypothetical protein